MNKRALMLTAAAAALLSGQAYAVNPNPPCSTTTSVASPQLCDVTSAIATPLSTGAINPNLTSSQMYAPVGNMTIETNGSLVITTATPTAPALTINSGTSGASTQTQITNNSNITYTGVNYAVGVLMEEASAPTSPTGWGTAESWVGEYYGSSTSVINLTGAGSNKVGILFAGAAFDNSADTGTTTNAAVGLYANTSASGNLGVFTGAIDFPTAGTTPVAVDLAAGSTLEVQGPSSYGIELIGPSYSAGAAGGATLIGDIDVGGTITMSPTAADGAGSTAIEIAGWMPAAAGDTNPALTSTYGVTTSSYPGADQAYVGAAYAMVGNIDIGAAGATTQGSVTSAGAGAQGIVILGAVDGGINNYGTLETYGSSPSASTASTDAEAGSALVIANTVEGGVYNAGPTTAGGGTAAGIIATWGTEPTIDISPSANTSDTSYQPPITIGLVTSDSVNVSNISLLNRGTISAESQDPGYGTLSAPISAIAISGTSAAPTTLTGGIFNSGAISATATSNAANGAGSVYATAISVGQYVTVTPGTDTFYTPNVTAALINSNETNTTTGGTITATVSGLDMGVATAISIAPNATLPSLFNSGTISASATTTTLTDTGTLAACAGTFGACAIDDQSGTLTVITNYGTISATQTTLNASYYVTDGIAFETLNSGTSPITITDLSTSTNAATITGDIYFNKATDTLTVTGNATYGASVTGNINFYNTTVNPDILTIGSYGTFTGEIAENSTGSVDISIAANGTLNLLTTLPENVNTTASAPTIVAGTPLSVGTLNETGGTLNISLSQAYNTAVYSTSNIINAGSATLSSPGSGGVHPLTISFGSFVANPTSIDSASTFVLISTPDTAGALTIPTAEMADLTSLYTGSANATNKIPFLFTTLICTYNVTNGAACPTGTSSNSELVFEVTPKSAKDLGLTGYAAQMFKYANEALLNDNALGAAMITDITNSGQAQTAYASFAPDLSGATRATVISLTDSATNIVAARQRELRMYVGQEGDTTLWGQQFAQRLSQNGEKNGLTGWNDPGFGFVLGLDDGDPVDGRYGGAFTFYTGGMSQKGPIDAKTEQEFYLLTGYTDWRGKGLFLDTQATIGYGNLKGRRYISLTDTATTPVTTVSREADGNRGSELLSGGVTTGAIFNAGATVFTPQLSVDGMTMREEGYSETQGGDGFDLTVQPYYADSLRTFLGADVRQDVNLGDIYIQPDLRVGYRYDFVDGAVKLRARFSSVYPADPFTIDGPDPGRGNLVLGGGLATTTGSWSIGLNYDYVRSGSGPTEQDGVVSLVGRI